MDIESPGGFVLPSGKLVCSFKGQAKTIHPRDWFTLNATAFPLVMQAFKKRISLFRKMVPHAKLGLYGTMSHSVCCPLNTTEACLDLALEAMQRASQLGVFDELDVLVPILFMGQHMDATTCDHTNMMLNHTIQITDSTGLRHLPLAAMTHFASWEGNIPLPIPHARNHIACIERFAAAEKMHTGRDVMESVIAFAGKDNTTMQVQNIIIHLYIRNVFLSIHYLHISIAATVFLMAISF
jgi:hypothetical protein